MVLPRNILARSSRSKRSRISSEHNSEGRANHRGTHDERSDGGIVQARVSKSPPKPRATHQRVGERIRELRVKSRVRQKTLARMVGLSPGALTNFEKGRRRISLDWLIRIGEALDTPVTYFLENTSSTGTHGDPREVRLLKAWRALARQRALQDDYLRLLEHLSRRKRR